ncbi:uncharacterized protein BT62DRAFT_1077367 [Guyanagaster necrorhizus]|uniref:Secreted protein n=1 Tax=Guyanagaster necrorhizus TaxID=856835 RepID=A0A9P8ARR2_9AGAR|nr:uncharacterized protein BT62DRAFT_1077367 [Guyanagaster necrorhizus MCA 3950]KAG7445176.1 hypothetical protein BT62DRAFT_1077367 [Guyanagaster necrorhizus MCA 3950]
MFSPSVLIVAVLIIVRRRCYLISPPGQLYYPELVYVVASRLGEWSSRFGGGHLICALPPLLFQFDSVGADFVDLIRQCCTLSLFECHAGALTFTSVDAFSAIFNVGVLGGDGLLQTAYKI